MPGKKESIVFLSFLLGAIILRFPIFFPVVIDHDESTYIVIADQLLEGKVPYVDNLDIKPVGIYLTFALILMVFKSIIAIRVFTALVIGFSAFLIYRIHKRLFVKRDFSILSGLLFLLCGSLHKWSWSSNTEIYFVCCSLLCLYLLVTGKKALHFLLFGVVAGCGFLYKFHIAVDLVAFALFYFFWISKDLGKWLVRMSLAFVGFAIIISSVILIYWGMGFLAELRFAMIDIPGAYALEHNWLSLIGFLGEFYLSFLPVTIILLLNIKFFWNKNGVLIPQKVLLVSWTLLAWVGVTITGKQFFHYYYQLISPLCLFAFPGFLLSKENANRNAFEFLKKRSVLFLLIVIVAVWINQYMQVLRKPDLVKIVNKDLSGMWSDGDRIYTNEMTILYFMLDVGPPTRYVHSSILHRKDLIDSYHLDVEKEYGKIMDQEITYYLLRGDPPEILAREIEKEFLLLNVYDGNLNLFGRAR